MCSTKLSTTEKSIKTDQKIHDYLEKKYGKEPKISKEELKRLQWNWH
jgi:hypothetical protein